MPTFEYICRKNDPSHPVTQSRVRPVEDRDEPATCLICGGKMRRILTAPNVVVKAADKAAK